MIKTKNNTSPFTATLPCGMRVLILPSMSNVVYCGIAVKAGTRDELPHESGMAHFCEHLTFKGTKSRTSRQIINYMESVGGDVNAYTGKEETVYYASVLKEDFRRAAKILCDIVLNSTYPQSEMEKEVEVVIDEIESYKDSPSELIFDEFEQLIFKGHPLGRNILGEADRLRTLKREDVLSYARRMYRPENMIFFIHGQVNPETAVNEINKNITEIQNQKTETETENSTVFSTQNIPVPPYQAESVYRKKDTHQAHVLIGTRAYGANDSRHIPLYLLNNILGGPGMSSRFNLILRERNGLVYTVESNITSYTDTGVWSVYFGCDPHDVTRCRKLILKELERWRQAPVSERILTAAKKQIKGQIGISYDNSENVALSSGKTFLLYHKIKEQKELFQKIDSITAGDLHQIARELFAPENLTTLIYQ